MPEPLVRRRRCGKGGGTLVEILLSIAVISTLFILVSSKVDIGDIFAKLTSTGDEIAVRAIGSSLSDYRWDYGGSVPPDANLSSVLQPICKQEISPADCAAAGGVSLQALILNQTYLTEIPVRSDFRNHPLFTGYRAAFPYGSGMRVFIANDEMTEVFEY